MLREYVGCQCTPPTTGTTITLGAPITGYRSFSAPGAFVNGNPAFYLLFDGSQIEWGYATVSVGGTDQLTGRTPIGNSAGNTTRLNFAGTTFCYNALPSANTVYRDQTGVWTMTAGLATTPLEVLSIASDTTNAAGAGLKMIGNGATTPKKWLRARGGNLEIVNDAYSAAIAILTDAGALSLASTLACGPITCAGGGSFSAVLSNPGYQKNPSGSVDLWGRTVVVPDGSGNATINFPLTLPASTFYTAVVCNGGAAASLLPCHLIGGGASGISVNVPGGSGISYTVAWRASGA